MFKAYFRLTKPGIVLGNVITAVAGFFLASKGHINVALLLATLTGISLGIASACVLNNYFDREIDAKMRRTKSRPLVTGTISPHAALVFAVVLGITGFTALAAFTNISALLAEAVGFFFYEVVYGLWKRFSVWSTMIGSVSGAMPPVVGYTAVTGRIDEGCALLFLLLFFWQIPHFYSIALYRLDDYKAAGVPLLPIVQGIFVTKVHILLGLIGFAVITMVLAHTEFTGSIYPSVILIFSFLWITYAAAGFSTKNTFLWARYMFVFSLLINICLSMIIIAHSLSATPSLSL